MSPDVLDREPGPKSAQHVVGKGCYAEFYVDPDGVKLEVVYESSFQPLGKAPVDRQWRGLVELTGPART